MMWYATFRIRTVAMTTFPIGMGAARICLQRTSRRCFLTTGMPASCPSLPTSLRHFVLSLSLPCSCVRRHLSPALTTRDACLWQVRFLSQSVFFGSTHTGIFLSSFGTVMRRFVEILECRLCISVAFCVILLCAVSLFSVLGYLSFLYEIWRGLVQRILYRSIPGVLDGFFEAVQRSSAGRSHDIGCHGHPMIGWGFCEALIPVARFHAHGTICRSGLLNSVGTSSSPIVSLAGAILETVDIKRFLIFGLFFFIAAGVSFIIAGLFGSILFFALALALTESPLSPMLSDGQTYVRSTHLESTCPCSSVHGYRHEHRPALWIFLGVLFVTYIDSIPMMFALVIPTTMVTIWIFWKRLDKEPPRRR